MNGTTPSSHQRLDPRPKYLSLAIVASQRVLAQRRTLFLNLISNFIWVIVSYSLWQTVFTLRPQIDNFDWERMRSYVLVTYALNMLFASSLSVYRLLFMIRSGDIANELIRPFDFLHAQLSIAFGNALIEGLFSGSVVILLGLLTSTILPPPSLLALAAFFLSVLFGFVIKFLIYYLMALLCFWTINWLGIYLTYTAIVNIFSGALIPLQFFPDWLQTIALNLPFQAIIHLPLAIYLGELQGNALGLALATQIFWIIALWLLARLLWFPSLKALEIQGG